MAHTLKINVVAEGVETEKQLEFLERNQCDEVQGFLCSRPVPAEAFTRLLKESTQENFWSVDRDAV